MKKTKEFKDVHKEVMLTLVTFIWSLLIGINSFILFQNIQILIKILLSIITIGYTIIGFIILNKSFFKQEKIEKQNYNFKRK